MAHVTVTSLLRTIELEFFQSHSRPLPHDQEKIIAGYSDLLQSLRDTLQSVQSILERLDGFNSYGHETLPRDLGTELRYLALNAENDIESALSDIYLAELIPAEEQPPFSKLRQVLQRAVHDFVRMKKDLVRIQENKNNNPAEDVAQTRKLVTYDDVVPKFHSSVRISEESPEEIMVGKQDERDEIIKLLFNGTPEMQVVSVHGMGGIGKTVLAKSVYEDNEMKVHFDICAWVVISQHHRKDQMLSRLLKSILKEAPEDVLLSTEEQIYRHLKGQRYLIVMDDVWSNEAWDDVRNCFPDDGDRSRVLLTTRLKNVAEYASGCSEKESKNCYQMRLLAPEESRKLFNEKLFLKESSDPEFDLIRERVVEKCYGLPLAVVVAAGLFWNLSRVEEWKRVEKALDSLETKSIAERCSDILALSYNHLPHYLKSCFLYFGFFPKNFPLIVKWLVNFWTAEGFLKEAENESFEQVGEKHLQQLIDRNLIMVMKDRLSSYGKIRACTIHDLLHDLSIKEAQKENLLYVVGEQRLIMDCDDFRWINARKESCSDPHLYARFNKCHSLVYFEEDKEAVKLMKHGVFKQTFGPRKHIADLLQVCPRLIRVLELSSFQCLHELDDLTNWIADLVHLRYLSLIIGWSSRDNFPLSKARNLHTIRISAGFQDPNNDPFPPFILEELPQLRYLKCWPSCVLFPPDFVHQNLHTVSSISPDQCTLQLFAKIPLIRKLSVTGDTYFFLVNGKNLSSLPLLESLSIDFGKFSASGELHTPKSFIEDIASLQGIKKLKLMCSEILWKHVNVLSRLPNLQVLKLFFQACIGRKWNLKEEEEYVFCSLKYLYIDYSSLVEWEANSDNFPQLERLILSRCFNLKEIPSDFGYISSLKSIEIIGCPPSVVESAEQIKDEQRDYGNDDMVVVVHKLPSNTAGASGPYEQEEEEC